MKHIKSFEKLRMWSKVFKKLMTFLTPCPPVFNSSAFSCHWDWNENMDTPSVFLISQYSLWSWSCQQWSCLRYQVESKKAWVLVLPWVWRQSLSLSSRKEVRANCFQNSLTRKLQELVQAVVRSQHWLKVTHPYISMHPHAHKKDARKRSILLIILLQPGTVSWLVIV